MTLLANIITDAAPKSMLAIISWTQEPSEHVPHYP